jgi:hypothetical protein
VAPPALLTTVAIERGDADQRGNGAAVQASKFRQLPEQRARRGRPDAGDAAQQLLLDPPRGMRRAATGISATAIAATSARS